MNPQTFQKFSSLRDLNAYLDRIEAIIAGKKAIDSIGADRLDEFLAEFNSRYKHAELRFSGDDENEWQKVRQRFDQIYIFLNRLHYLTNLMQPPDKEDFKSSLYWISENGTEDTLNTLVDIYQNPPFSDSATADLIYHSGCNLAKKIFEPDRIVEEGEQTYLAHRGEWDKVYSNKYIAISRDKVIADATTRKSLNNKISELRGPFNGRLFYIVKVGQPITISRQINSVRCYPSDNRQHGKHK